MLIQRRTAKSLLKLKMAVVAAAAAGAMLAAPQIADACTRILWNNNKLAVGRTMDWPESTHPILTMLPRAISRDGGQAGPQIVVADNPARWTSKYASLVTSMYGIGTADGLNERGLGAHMLYLHETDFGPRDASKPGLQPAGRPVGAVRLGQRGDGAGGARSARQGPSRQGDDARPRGQCASGPGRLKR
jgi:hypothetical protein